MAGNSAQKAAVASGRHAGCNRRDRGAVDLSYSHHVTHSAKWVCTVGRYHSGDLAYLSRALISSLKQQDPEEWMPRKDTPEEPWHLGCLSPLAFEQQWQQSAR